MVNKDQEQELIGRYRPRGTYDKRFIAEVLEQIHNGMPRQQACDKYNISPRTLRHWIEADRMAISSDNLYKKLSHQVKRSIVRAVESKRLSIKEAQMTYSIRSASTIRKWIKQFQQENNELALVNESGMKKKKPTQSNSIYNNQDIKALQKAL